MKMIPVPSGIESMMHGVALFEFSGRKCTAIYTDGTRETAQITEVQTKAMESYFRYQNENGPACDAPNSFALVSAIQRKRKNFGPLVSAQAGISSSATS